MPVHGRTELVVVAPDVLSSGENADLAASRTTSSANEEDDAVIDIENPRSNSKVSGDFDFSNSRPSSEKWDIVLADFGLAARVQNTKIQSERGFFFMVGSDLLLYLQ